MYKRQVYGNYFYKKVNNMKIAIVDDEAYWREKAEECSKEEMKSEIAITVYDNPISYLESKDEYHISLIDI